MLKNCPDPVDVQDLQFKLHCRLKVFNNKELNTFSQSPSLVSCASRYGLLFVGLNTANFQVIPLKCMENYSPKDKDITNYPRRNVALPSAPKHVCINCDSTILAVVVERDKCPTVIFYDVLSFLRQNIRVIKEVRLSPTPGVFVTETNWNPALPLIYTVCKSDGTLGVYEIKDNAIDINELPRVAEVTSFCWSPKGKQIAVGSKNGKIAQYKPDLKAVKIVNEPPLEGLHSVISLQWVSNYQFIGIYQSAQADSSAKLIVVDAPKIGDTSYTNYEDICYSGSCRAPQFYMILQQHWNILMVASSNSTELGVLASTGDTWTQWILSDSARAELPLSSDHQETLPVGLALDISSTKPLPWNESSIPPCPYLLILSHEGVLCVFNIANLKEGVPSICTPPDPVLDTSGMQQFVTSESVLVPQDVTVTVKTTTPLLSFSATQMQNAPPVQASTFEGKTLTQPQPGYAAPGSLFGGQTTLNKPLIGMPTTSTTTSNTNVNEKYSSIFAALNTPTSTPVTSQSKPIVISMAPLPKVEPSTPVEQTIVQVKPNASAAKLSEPKTTIDIKIKGETDALLAQMIREECVSLESELKALLHHGRSLKIDIGSDAEKTKIVSEIHSLQEFIKEIVDISAGENAEVHYLKQNLIQAWAWFEEAHSRYNSSKDETVLLLLRSQPLDSATEKRQADIRKLMYYIESQITQASKALDEQWDSFQDYAKKTHRMQMPTMESIFQTMVRQNAILQKQSYVLKDIASRLKRKTRSIDGPSLLLSIGNTKDLEDNLKRLQLEHPLDLVQIQYDRVLKRMRNLSLYKTNKLRDLLKSREICHIKAVKPQLSSSLMLQPPESKSRQLISNLLSLESKLSPVKKTGLVPRQLIFGHSTPLREPTIDIEPTETPPNTPQIDPNTFTFKKIETSSSAVNLVSSATGFIPLAKSASAFSNLPQATTTQPTLPTHALSAFVPTTQVTFSTNKPFSFTPAITTTTTVLKTVMTTGIDTTSAFTVGTTSAALPKFGAAVAPKTTSLVATTQSTVKTSTPIAKTTLSQFNFGSNLSITPVNTSKKTEAAMATTTAASTTTKPAFNFSGMFSSAKVESSTAAKTATTTSSIFGSKPLFGTSTSSTSFTFAAGPSTSKVSAFSAVSSSTSSSTVPNVTVTTSAIPKSEATVMSVTQSSIFGSTDSTVTKSTDSIFGNSLSSPTTTKPMSLFGNVSPTKPQSSFGTTVTVPTTLVSTPSTANTTPFSNLTITTKPLPAVATGSSTTTQAAVTSTIVSPAAATSIKPQPLPSTLSTASSTDNTSTVTPVLPTTGATTTSAVTKLPVATSGGATTSTPGLFFGGPKTTSIFGSANTNSEAATTTQPTSALDSPTSSAIKASVFGSTPTSTQPSIFGASASKAPQTATSGSIGTTQSSIFGSSATPTTTLIFGGATTQSSVLGTSATIATTSSSIFATTSAPIQTSIFGIPTTTSATTSAPVFGTSPASPQPSIFGTPTTTTATSSTSVFGTVPTISQPSIFGTSTTAMTTTNASIFGTAPSPSQPSIFGTPAATTASASIFGSTPATTQSSVFGTPVTSTSIFGATSATSQPSIFGTPTTATTTTSIFGATPAITQSSIFGNSVAASTTNSIFGGASTTQPSIFGTTTSSVTTTPSIFGTATTTVFGPNTGQMPIFGAGTSQPSIFGGVSTTKPSIFDTNTSVPATQSSIFGAPSAPSTQSSPFSATPSTAASPFTAPFGSASTTTSSSPFGQSIFGVAKTTASPFGATFGSSSAFNSAPATTASIFGQPASFGSTTSSLFSAPTTTSNIFGSTTGGSTFGATSSSSNVFGSTAAPSTSFSFAGAANNAVGNTGSFGFGGLNVGTATTSNNVFGGGATFGQSAAPSANPFARTEQKSAFGGGGSIFGSPTSASGSVFGSNTDSFFGNNAQSGFGSSAFGSASTFGQQQAAFGQNTFGNTSFGSPQPGPFSSGGAGVGQSGFGSPTGFQKPSGFGSSPVFGGSPQPAFGGAPSFGGAPAFGAAPTFGSPSGFGAAASGNAGFGSLANQNTVGFGSLAQQATTPNSTPFSGSSSFSSWR